MCGICGLWYFDQERQIDHDVLQAMTAQLVHRGPDAAGFYVDGSMGMGVRRLSVIDCAGSQQPIQNEDQRLCLACNGEIYNFRSLRRELSPRHQFSTDGDVETVLHLFEEFGLHCVDHLRGMFAFALWDRHAKQLIAAVDRFGEKPLYYLCDAEKVVFASELKALLRCPGVLRELDDEALDQYLSCGYVSAPRSIFRAIRKLAPGQIMTVQRNGAARIEPYWQPIFAQAAHWEKRSFSDMAAELRALLVDAVRLRMTSDVPLGAFLSGGVDSAAVVALMTSIGAAPVKTFSIGFEHPAYDESAYAQTAARFFQSEHICEIMREDALNLLPRLVRHFDEPLADASILPTYLVSRLARQQVTVALGGDGGDEVFGGYHQHLYAYRQRWLQALIPASLHPAAVRLAKFLPRAAKLQPYLAALDGPAERWLTHGFFSAQQRSCLYKPETRQALAGYEGEQVKRAAKLDELSQAQYHDLTVYLPGDILVKVDRASMLASLEVRAPLLDHTVFEFMARVPPRFRVGLTGGKHLLKKALGDLLPPFVQHRSKQGFSIPQAEWLRGSLNPLLCDVLSDSCISTRFDPVYVRQLVDEHMTGRADHKDRLWTLLCFGLWAREQA